MGLVEWWRALTRKWVIPVKDGNDGEKVPLYKGLVTDKNRSEFERLWKQLADLERHEDTLFNNRSQSFLVVTSFLLAGMSQFRDSAYFPVQVLFCLFGLVFSFCALLILLRTGRTIEWYLEALCRLDKELYLDDMRPYLTRREKTKRRSAGSEGKYRVTPVTAILGVMLPAFAIAMWLAMGTWSVSAHISSLRAQSNVGNPGRTLSSGDVAGQPSQITVPQDRSQHDCVCSKTTGGARMKQAPAVKRRSFTTPCQNPAGDR